MLSNTVLYITQMHVVTIDGKECETIIEKSASDTNFTNCSNVTINSILLVSNEYFSLS